MQFLLNIKARMLYLNLTRDSRLTDITTITMINCTSSSFIVDFKGGNLDNSISIAIIKTLNDITIEVALLSIDKKKIIFNDEYGYVGTKHFGENVNLLVEEIIRLHTNPLIVH
jgi:hypothetical protein